MWLNKEIFNEDLENISNLDFIPWDKLANKSILVTGATGLIGFNLVCALLYASKKFDLDLKIIVQIRDEQKAKKLFFNFLDYENLEFLKSDIKKEFEIKSKLDFIIHGANPTSSEYFILKPVELINEIVTGTSNILKLSRDYEVKSLVYLSTMEVYGSGLDDEPICENSLSLVDTMALRSSYPEAKRLAENLCASYAYEYGVNAKVARLAQCFGPGVSKNDNRVFADFARCVLKKQDIELLTMGRSKRSYVYTMDAISAIIAILLKGEKAEAYNVANEKNYCSIKEMAELLAKEFEGISVKFLKQSVGNQKFSPPHMLNLSTQKLQTLGWNSNVLLLDMFKRMMK